MRRLRLYTWLVLAEAEAWTQQGDKPSLEGRSMVEADLLEVVGHSMPLGPEEEPKACQVEVHRSMLLVEPG